MENILSQTMQHRKVLFLISLPRTPEFQDCVEDVNECLDELRQLNVDVREHIWVEDLVVANQFDFVIVVAHRNTSSDELVFADGKMSISDFVSSIPADFKGVMDFSSCYSATVFTAIKEHCPQCKAQVALVETTLLRRLIIYPTLVEYLYDNPEIDYGTAYKEVSKAFDNVVDEIDDIDRNSSPMTHLGEQMTSVYAPKEVKRNSIFQIIVFFHYDSERGVVKVKAERWQSNAIIRDETDIQICLNENDKISVTLSFDPTDDDNLKEINNEYTKNVTVKKELVIETFKVKILPDFRCNSFLANIEMAKEQEPPFVRCTFDVYISDTENKAPAEVIAEIPQYSVKPGDIIKNYVSTFTCGVKNKDYKGVSGNLFNNSEYELFLKSLAGDNDEDRLSSIRKFVYNNNLFIDTISSFLKKCESNIAKRESDCLGNSENINSIVPVLKGYVSNLQKKMEAINNKLTNIKKRVNRFKDGSRLFIPLENGYLAFVLQVATLGHQIDILYFFNELKEKIGRLNKLEIKGCVNRLYQHPHYHYTDKYLFDLFKASGTKSIIHNASGGTTMPFLALALAMAEGKYESYDKGGKHWDINVEKYLDLSDNHGSLRTPKSRINNLVGLLDNKEIRDKIKNYQKKDLGKISVAAYYLLRIKINIQ